MFDFGKLTERQQHTLGMIAINEDKGHHPKTLESLLKKGLIGRDEQTIPGRFPVRIWRYYVPIHVHIQWCQWCADNYEESR